MLREAATEAHLPEALLEAQVDLRHQRSHPAVHVPDPPQERRRRRERLGAGSRALRGLEPHAASARPQSHRVMKRGGGIQPRARRDDDRRRAPDLLLGRPVLFPVGEHGQAVFVRIVPPQLRRDRILRRHAEDGADLQAFVWMHHPDPARAQGVDGGSPLRAGSGTSIVG
jgi:hypothetical protein